MRIIVLLLSFMLLFACNDQRQQRQLQAREDSLVKRTAELNAKEQELALREATLQQRVQAMDSLAQTDTVQTNIPAVNGTWNVQMTCTEATCTGSAVGDTKTESWTFDLQGSTIIARAMASNQLVRVYSGTYQDGMIRLTDEQANAASAANARMNVRLKPVSPSRMEGEREIIRENNCRIVYALQLDATTK